MQSRFHPLTAALAVAFSSVAVAQTAPESGRTLDNVVVSAKKLEAAESALKVANPVPQAVVAGDSAALLRDLPGVQLYGAGGVSSLPVMHGLADDRLRIQVDGMDLISACANHMNPPLSYIDPTQVGSVKVYAGITPVSVGGDSIGGAIVVNSATPRFASAGNAPLVSGQLGTFYRSNGDAHGVNASATIANENLSLTYTGATAQSGNYKSAKAFKAAGQAAWGQEWLAGDEVGSSRYKSENQALTVALRNENHLLDFKVGVQHIPYQGFPNQHMDMTDNRSTQLNLHYLGKYDWGTLESRIYNEHTRHKMNFGDDKLYWYGATHTIPGMPMDTEGHNTGAQLKAEINLNGRDLLRTGVEYQRYRLDDWWDPSGGGMAPNTFVNINNGQRDRYDIYGEWEARWSEKWVSLVGARSSTVKMDTGTVQGYNTTMANYLRDSTAFNNRDRSRSDDNLDLSVLARYTADATQTYEGGYSRKTRSPSLYERYTWSTGGMAMAMVNWNGDGNGYVGNLDLKPEVAHTLSFTADWHDSNKENWGLRLTPYLTYVNNFIEARCLAASCASDRFVNLTLVNQDARLFGVDLAGFLPLARSSGFGNVTGRGQLSYVDGRNQTTGDNLYNIMPLNAKLALEHRLGNWSNTIEQQLVAGKHQVSGVHNEMKTKGYGLLNLRSSYQWQHVRLDLGLENVLNKQYALPLGGAYIGQGTTMSLNGAGAPYGVVVPGMGRSFYAGVNISF
ncbi:MAG: TonB-dependent receptor [Rhodocyclales bacterium GT-UBC]|nr:MAG: TonB-dependent receptor [Rhodocyclales bacterium GT-UBC]